MTQEQAEKINGATATAQPKKEDLIPQNPFSEWELSPDKWREKMYKGWQGIGFAEGRMAAFDYMKEHPDCTFYDLISNVKFETEL